jgi:hypothetical protein
MSSSAYLETYFRVGTFVGITDVDDIIDNLRAELIDEPPVGFKWTEPVAGYFMTPTREDGLFLTVHPTRISATRIAWVVADHNLMQVNNATDTRQDIDGAGTTVVIMSGPQHLVVDSARATPETWCCGIACRSPELDSVPRGIYFASVGPRNNAGTINANTVGEYWLLPTLAAAYSVGSGAGSHCISTRMPIASGAAWYDRFTITGGALAWPVEFLDDDAWFGKFPQAIMVDEFFAVGYEFIVPINEIGDLGTFRVCGWPYSAYARYHVAVRVA